MKAAICAALLTIYASRRRPCRATNPLAQFSLARDFVVMNCQRPRCGTKYRPSCPGAHITRAPVRQKNASRQKPRLLTAASKGPWPLSTEN